MTPWREWIARVALMVLAPVFVALALEAGLRLAGYGYPTRFFIKDPAEGPCRDNRKFVWQFYSPKTQLSPQPFSIAARKPAGAIRVFILGESAAVGTPDPSFGFGRILERMLRRQYPQTKFEVVNAAIRGINSHIILPIARDCAELEPDLFIAYMGNNEVVGLYAPGPHSGYLTPHLRLLRTIQWLKTTRLGEWVSAATARSEDPYAAENQDMPFFRKHRLASDDPKRAAVYANFQANLEAICRVVIRSRAKLILSTVPVNLADSPPFGSLHRADLTEGDRARWENVYAEGITAESQHHFEDAIARYLAAGRLDDHFADLHFRLGRCYFASGRYVEARQQYTLARDWDALQFRADTRINQIIRRVASLAGTTEVSLVDAESAFTGGQQSDHGIPGDNFFYEHVHLRFDADYLLARTLYPSVVAALGAKLAEPATGAIPSRDECAASLAFTSLDEVKLDSAMIEVPTQPPFLDQLYLDERLLHARQALTNRFGNLNRHDVKRAVSTYLAAIQVTPGDWQLHYNFASLYFNLHDFTAAVEQFETARKLLPSHPLIALGLSRALAESGKFDAALECLAGLVRDDPGYQPARDGLATVNAMKARRGMR